MGTNKPEQTSNSMLSKNTYNKSSREVALEGTKYPRISNAQRVKDSHIKQALAQVYVIIGLHPDYYPKGPVNDMLISYIREHMADLSLRDVVNAFILGVQKKLNVKDRRGNLQPLQMDEKYNFSIRFLEEVIGAYREYQKPFLKQLKDVKQIEKKKPWTTEDSIDTYVGQYERFLKGKEVLDFGGTIFKAMREDVGFIRVTDDEIEELLAERISQPEKADDMSLNDFMNKLTNKGKEDKRTRAVSEVKNRKLKELFMELKDGDVTPDTFREMLKDKLL